MSERAGQRVRWKGLGQVYYLASDIGATKKVVLCLGVHFPQRALNKKWSTGRTFLAAANQMRRRQSSGGRAGISRKRLTQTPLLVPACPGPSSARPGQKSMPRDDSTIDARMATAIRSTPTSMPAVALHSAAAAVQLCRNQPYGGDSSIPGSCSGPGAAIHSPHVRRQSGCDLGFADIIA